eukprot:CAMPEP_0119306736 /NCGR_PEP_ID=MMETSP1333-20130426/7414_1 /TAXON_ID=418940 /ORGANISM="Scyphosphaera apsteinii, Strain RCC1455" /LENGTH=555 /DNA_ID=CAMNT_0007310113 /DNA_START=25 /DNA_END=1692 /DNA_ORIENTATION=-
MKNATLFRRPTLAIAKARNEDLGRALNKDGGLSSILTREEREDLPVGPESNFSLAMGAGSNVKTRTEGALRLQYTTCPAFSDEQVDQIIFILKAGLGLFAFGSPTHIIAGEMTRLHEAFDLPGTLMLDIGYTAIIVNVYCGPTHILHHTQGFGLNKTNDIHHVIECVVDAKTKAQDIDMLRMLQAVDNLVNRANDFSHWEWQLAFYVFPMALSIAVFSGSWLTLATTASICAIRLAFSLCIKALGHCCDGFSEFYERFESRIRAIHVTILLPFWTGLLTALIGEKIFNMELSMLPGVYLAIMLFYLPALELINGGSEMINGMHVGVTRLFMGILETMYMGCSLFLGWTCATSSPMPTSWPSPGGLPWWLTDNGLFAIPLLAASMILFGVQKKASSFVAGMVAIKCTLLAGDILAELLPMAFWGSMQYPFFQTPISMIIACAVASTCDLLIGETYQAVLIPILVIRAPNVPALLSLMSGLQSLHQLEAEDELSNDAVKALIKTSYGLFTLLMNAASFSIGIQVSMAFWQPFLKAKWARRAAAAGLSWTKSDRKTFF